MGASLRTEGKVSAVQASSAIMRVTNRSWLLAVGLATAAICAWTTLAGANKLPPKYSESPVFFEKFGHDYVDLLNKTLLHEGKVRLKPLGVESIDNFDWMHHTRKDLSFWLRMERMEYLIPLMYSDEPRDKEFVHGWIVGWLDAHESNPTPNPGNNDAMAIGIRGMMLTWVLRQRELSHPEDQQLIIRLKRSIKWHQDYLRDPKHFNTTSNHGMWEAMGLFETTRVWPSPSVAEVALDRLHKIVTLSVSRQGFHREHSPSYHFYFLQWLSGFVPYLEGLDLEWPLMRELANRERRMHEAAYYLCDHKMYLPQIGDTDVTRLATPPALSNETDVPEGIFDKEAGYGIFKDNNESSHRRYVVFCVQNEEYQPGMRYHFHNDMMAVYYSYDGEVILSDQGRYSYSNSPTRNYIKSNIAHNTLLPERFLTRPSHAVYLAQKAWWQHLEDQVIFGAGLRGDLAKRLVTIPDDEPVVEVMDAIRDTVPYVVLWHIGPDVQSIGLRRQAISLGHARYEWELVTHRAARFDLTVEMQDADSTWSHGVEIVRGQKNPLLGWYSPDYNVLWPVPTLLVTVDPKGDVEIVTRLRKTN